MSGRWRLEERSQKKEGRSPRMCREQSDGEDDVVGAEVDRFVDATAETEVELRLHLGTGMEPDQIPNGMPIPWGFSAWTSSYLTWRGSADSNPRAGPI